MATQKFLAIKDGTTTRVILKRDLLDAKNNKILGIMSEEVKTYATYFDLYKANIGQHFKDRVFLVLNMKDFAKYEPALSAVYHFKAGDQALVFYDDTNTPHFVNTKVPKIETVGTWNELNAKITEGEKDRIYKVEDMSGKKGFANNEHAFWYLNGTTTPDLVSREQGVYSSGADELLLHNIQELQFSSYTSGGKASITFGDLSQEDERHAFMENALEEQDYSFKVGSVVYHMVVKTKTGDGKQDADTITVEGFKYGNGEMEPHTLVVKRTGISNDSTLGMKASKYEFATVEDAATYADEHAMPTKVIKQLIGESNLTGNYTSQVGNLKVLLDLKDLTPGLTKEYTIPNSLTTATIGGCEIAMNYTKDGEIGTTTQGFDLRGWDTSKPLYLSMTYHSNATYIWVEMKLESVAGDNTKLKITNYKSGAAGTEMNAFGVASIQFKGDQ